MIRLTLVPEMGVMCHHAGRYFANLGGRLCALFYDDRRTTHWRALGENGSCSNSIKCLEGKKKVKLSPCLTNLAKRHEGVWGSGCTDPHFLDLGTS
jgi:hypothetical protein